MNTNVSLFNITRDIRLIDGVDSRFVEITVYITLGIHYMVRCTRFMNPLTIIVLDGCGLNLVSFAKFTFFVSEVMLPLGGFFTHCRNQESVSLLMKFTPRLREFQLVA